MMAGCVSAPQQNAKSIEAKPVAQFAACTEISNIPQDYPWSIPGYHDTRAKHTDSFGITQTRGTPDQFTICTDCPCPTAKNIDKSTTGAADKNRSSNLKKVVIHFDHGDYQLSEQHQNTLARMVRSLPKDYRLTITGYTDNTKPGGNTTNEALAQHRAQAVSDYLITLGVQKQQMTVKAAPLCCYIAANTTDTGRALNRRTEIIIAATSSSTNR